MIKIRKMDYPAFADPCFQFLWSMIFNPSSSRFHSLAYSSIMCTRVFFLILFIIRTVLIADRGKSEIKLEAHHESKSHNQEGRNYAINQTGKHWPLRERKYYVNQPIGIHQSVQIICIAKKHQAQVNTAHCIGILNNSEQPNTFCRARLINDHRM